MRDAVHATPVAPRAISLLALGGTIAVALALWLAGTELTRTSSAVASLRRDSTTLAQSNAALVTASDSLRGDVANLRRALTSARSAITAYHQGRFDDAVAMYDLAIRDDSANAYLLDLRAYSLFKANRLEAALEGINLSIRADSTYEWAYFDKARIQCALRDLSGARATLKKLQEQAPSMASTIARDGEFRRVCFQLYQ